MIRLSGLVNLKSVGLTPQSVNEEELSGKQNKLDVDKDGKIEAEDLEKLRKQKNKKVDEADNPTPSNDHEVSMASNSLESIIQHANELKTKLGQEEKDIPAWIQDHITNAENYIAQAASNYHEYNTPNTPEEPQMEPMNEKAPEGWEGTVKSMKKHKEIDNPFALAHYMKSKGYKSHKGK